MTGKERLEKAKKILNHIKGYGVYDGNDDIEIFEWLIKQAERVQELEEEIRRIRRTKYRHAYEQGKFDTNMKVWYEMPELEYQNRRYRETLELLVKQETLGKDAKTSKTAISYNGMIALKGLGIFNDDEYIVYGVDEIIENVRICDRCNQETCNYEDEEGYIICNSCIYEMLGGN